MPSKSYSKEQREEVRLNLLKTALQLYSLHGIKKVSLMDVLKPVGISKPFFYTFFDSVQSFIIEVLDYQWNCVSAVIKELENLEDWTWQQKARVLLDKIIHYRDNGLLVMTQAEELWVRDKLSDAEFYAFMDRQTVFFQEVLKLWNIPEEKCHPQVIGNMVISMIVVYSSAKEAIPFLYADKLEETVQVQAECIIAYLESVTKKA